MICRYINKTDLTLSLTFPHITDCPSAPDFVYQQTASHRPNRRGSTQGLQRTVSSVTSGELASVHRERSICCVSTPIQKCNTHQTNKSLKLGNLFSVTSYFILSAHFSHRKPSAGKVLRLIEEEGRKANRPKPDHIVQMWGLEDEAGHLFFFKAGQRDLCIDTQTFPCECRRDTDNVGRQIHRSTKNANLQPLRCVLKVDERTWMSSSSRHCRTSALTQSSSLTMWCQKEVLPGKGPGPGLAQ